MMTLDVRFTLEDNLHYAAGRMIEAATIVHCVVATIFNGVELRAEPGMKVADIVSVYMKNISTPERVLASHKSYQERMSAKLRLEAAAPQLFLACEMALEAFETNCAMDWDVLRQAIERARGE